MEIVYEGKVLNGRQRVVTRHREVEAMELISRRVDGGLRSGSAVALPGVKAGDFVAWRGWKAPPQGGSPAPHQIVLIFTGPSEPREPIPGLCSLITFRRNIDAF